MEQSGYTDRSDYRVDVLARRNRVTVSVDGVELADSRRCLIVDEQDHGIVFYFPPDDVHLERFEPDDRTSVCPFKGLATYRRLRDADREVLAWSYEHPHTEVARIAGYVAFYQDAVDLRIGEAYPAVSGR